MKNKNKLTGIITLAVVAVLAVVIIIGTNILTKKDNAPSNGADSIDLTGYTNTGNIIIRSASEVKADDGSLEGYLVTVASKGFGGDIYMDVTFDQTGDTVKSLVVNEHKETEGYGSKITEEAFLSQFNGLTAPVSLAGAGNSTESAAEAAPTEAAPAETTETANETVALADGTYVAETKGYEANGYNDKVSLTIAGGKITEVVWDAYNEAGELKSVLSADGAYEMTKDGPTWQEQAVAIADFVVQNQSTDAIAMNDEGKTDSVSGVSISVNTFVSLVKQCLLQASPKSLQDGTYTAQGTESNGYTGIVTLVVENGAITSVVWDAKDAKGEFKSYLSSTGKYVMVEGNPTWKEQADALAAFVIENQSTGGIVLDEQGKTDSVAGVSISVNEFVSLTEECLTKAASGDTSSDDAGETPAATPTETPSTDNSEKAPGEIDGVSGATVSSTAVVDGINKAQSFIKDFVLKK
jgi:major membrane immunogen (membrane-anchored lipoprotein)